MKSLRKNTRIKIIEYEEGTNEYGDIILKEKNERDVWAYYRHISAKEASTFRVDSSFKVTALFIVSFRVKVDSTMKILYKGDEYRITHIDDYEGFRNDIKIYAYKVGIQENK